MRNLCGFIFIVASFMSHVALSADAIQAWPKDLGDIGKIACDAKTEDGTWYYITIWDIATINGVSGRELRVQTNFRGNDGYDPVLTTDAYVAAIDYQNNNIRVIGSDALTLDLSIDVLRLDGEPGFKDPNFPRLYGVGKGRAKIIYGSLLTVQADAICSFASKAAAEGRH